MPRQNWTTQFWKQIKQENPFEGDCLPARVPLFGFGRPSLPIPHPWNLKEPLKIFEAFYWGTEKEEGSGKHNRYLDVPGFDRVLVSREPAIIRAILSATGDKPGQFDRDTAPTRGIARETGEASLLYANGAVWRRQKKLSAPPFSRSNLFQPEKFNEFEKTFRKTVAERLEMLRARQAESGSTITRLELEPEIKAVMLEMLVNNFFGGNVPYDELRARYVPALERLIDHMVVDAVAHRLYKVLRVLTGRNALLKKDRAAYEELTDIALSGRAAGSGLWEQFKSDAPDDKLRPNIRVFLAGALEATTSFAGWALSHLARAPHLQDQIFAEVRDMDVYDPENLEQAVTLNRVLEETLRLTPSLYFLPRWTTEDTWIETVDKRKMMIPKATHIRLDVWHANRCEEFWGEAVTGYPAHSFHPQRWEVLAKRGVSPKDMLHFGFGYGPRVCPGKFLGLLEVGLVVGAFVKVFRFKAVHQEVQAKAGVSTKPADGVLVDLEKRDP